VRALASLCRNAGNVVSREALISEVWGSSVVDESSLWQTIHVLRKTLSTHGAPNSIENVRGRGYRLTGAVQIFVPLGDSAPRRFRQVAAVVIAVAFSLSFSGPKFRADAPLTGESQRLYNLGRHYFSVDTEPALLRSKVIFEQLVTREPRSAKAHAALAETLSELAGNWGGNTRSPHAGRWHELVRKHKRLGHCPPTRPKLTMRTHPSPKLRAIGLV